MSQRMGLITGQRLILTIAASLLLLATGLLASSLHDRSNMAAHGELNAAQGDEGASESKDRVERRMTREQITEAQQLSREWFEAHPPGGN